MKNINYIALFSFALSLLSTSCDNETETLFDETASQRKTAAVEQYQKALKSSNEGWLFQYYPDEDISYGGYSYVVKFDDNDSVAVWFEKMSDLTDPYVSLYDVISYGGPVLTFNTYNPYMHYFSTPSSAEYNAKGGEYEFLLMNEDIDVITVQGTKNGSTMWLKKMTEPAEDYMAKVIEVADYISGAFFSAEINGEEVPVQDLNRNFTFEVTVNGKDTSMVVPYVVTDTGLSFYEKVEINGQTLQNFTLNKESSLLTSTEGNATIEVVLPPIDLNLATWLLDVSEELDCSEMVYAAWEQAYLANVNAWDEELGNIMRVGAANPNVGDYGISFFSYPGPYRAHYNLAFNGVAGHADYINIVKLSAGFNWTYYTHLIVFVNVITENSPFIAEIDDLETPAAVKLTSVNNPEVWFILRK
jgi:hypothetical protein